MHRKEEEEAERRQSSIDGEETFRWNSQISLSYDVLTRGGHTNRKERKMRRTKNHHLPFSLSLSLSLSFSAPEKKKRERERERVGKMINLKTMARISSRHRTCPGREKSRQSPLLQQTISLEFFHFHRCLHRRGTITQALIYTSSWLTLVSLIYHCRKRASEEQSNIYYHISRHLRAIVTARERERKRLLHCLSLFTFTAKRIDDVYREQKLAAQLESSFVCHRM